MTSVAARSGHSVASKSWENPSSIHLYKVVCAKNLPLFESLLSVIQEMPLIYSPCLDTPHISLKLYHIMGSNIVQAKKKPCKNFMLKVTR